MKKMSCITSRGKTINMADKFNALEKELIDG